jgi:hypothetical protein
MSRRLLKFSDGSSDDYAVATKRRLTALLLVPRLRIVAGTGFRLRA